MSDLEKKPESMEKQDEDSPSQGPNLVLMYSLIGLALVAAIIIAGLIVLPFYRGR